MPMPTTKAVTAAGYMTSDCLSEEFSRRRIYITGEICDALAAEALLFCCKESCSNNLIKSYRFRLITSTMWRILC